MDQHDPSRFDAQRAEISLQRFDRGGSFGFLNDSAFAHPIPPCLNSAKVCMVGGPATAACGRDGAIRRVAKSSGLSGVALLQWFIRLIKRCLQDDARPLHLVVDVCISVADDLGESQFGPEAQGGHIGQVYPPEAQRKLRPASIRIRVLIADLPTPLLRNLGRIASMEIHTSPGRGMSSER